MAVTELNEDQVKKIVKPKVRELQPHEKLDDSYLDRGVDVVKKGVGHLGQGVSNVAGFLGAEKLQDTFGDVTFNPETGETSVLSPEEIAELSKEGKRPGLFGESVGEPVDAFTAGAQFAGESLLGGPIVGRSFGLIKKGKEIGDAATKLDKIKAFPRKFANEVGERFRKSPGSFTAEETLAGFGAGTTGSFAAQIFPESDFAKLSGELLGGSAAPLTMATLRAGRNGVTSLINKVKEPRTETGGKVRSQERIKRAVPEEKQTDALSNLDRKTTIDPKTGKAVLLPAQRTGVRGLLALERDIAESSEELLGKSDEQIARANKVIQESFSQLDGGSARGVTPVVATIKERNAYLSNLLDTRIKIAVQKADDTVKNLGPSVTREQANIEVKEQLKSALKAARKQETELYEAVDPELKVPFSKSLSLLRKFEKETGKAQKADIPSEAKLLSEFSKKKEKSVKITGDVTPDELAEELTPEFTTLKELRSLQSKLRETERNARAGEEKKLNRARIAGKLAEAITEDINEIVSGKDAASAVKTAVNFSIELNARFSGGTVGKILGRSISGGEKIPGALTLEQTLGTGPKAAVALDNLIKVFDSPEAPSSALLINSTEDFLRSRFLKEATDNGQLVIRSARNFIHKNSEILGRLPNLKRQIDESINAGDALALTERQKVRVTLDDPKFSKATLFAEKGPIQAFKAIETLDPEAAGREMQLLVNRVARDKTGEALSGLKSGFVSFLMDGATTKTRDVNDLRFLSGLDLQDSLKRPSVKSMVSRLLTKGEQDRLETIARDLSLLEKRREVSLSKEGVIGDTPGKVLEMLAGLTGAAGGRRLGRIIGAGGTVQIPGIMATRFREMVAAGVKDPAARLLRDSIQDEELFRELVQFVAANGVLDENATRRLNFWAFNAMTEYGGTFEEDENSEAIR